MDSQFMSVQPIHEINGATRGQPDRGSDSESEPCVIIHDVPFEEPVLEYPRKRCIAWPNDASFARWMLLERPLGLSVDPNAAAEKLWRKREKRLRQAQLQSENEEDPVGKLSCSLRTRKIQ